MAKLVEYNLIKFRTRVQSLHLHRAELGPSELYKNQALRLCLIFVFGKAKLCYMYYVYILFSKKDARLYIGYTNDLKRRLHEHKSGKNIATRNRLPLLLIHYEAYSTWSDAKRREKYLKGGKGRSEFKIQLQDILKELGYKHL